MPFLQDKNIHVLMTIATDVAATQCPSLLRTAKSMQQKYTALWSSFAKCHHAYNAAKVYTEGEIASLAKTCKKTDLMTEKN